MVFTQLKAGDTEGIKRMSAMATEIVREHFDPIIGKAQNDYMINKFQTVESITDQLEHGYQYYFVTMNNRDIGFLAFYPRESAMYLSKFYLYKEERAKGYSKQMLDFVKRATEAAGLSAIELNVNRNNSAIYAYEKLGFVVIREEKNDIGEGFYMDDYVYQLKIDVIKTLRRELHTIPEASGCEVKTINRIKEFLRENTGLTVENYAGGVIAYYDSKSGGACEGLENTIAFRADFDAVSLPDGSASHLCGHDGHTAALLGVAMRLEEIKPKRNVLLIFQPAEETGAGAKAMVDVLDKYNVESVYGCHNLPGFDFGKVYTSFDSFACASCGMIFHINGSPAHAAYPESGVSPIKAVTKLFEAISKSQEDDCFEEGTFATLIGSAIGQKAFGTSAEKAEVWITVRSRSQEDFDRIKYHLESTVRNACESEGLSYSLELQDEFPATENDKDCAKMVLEKCDGEILREPMRWSEDFGHFLNRRKGAFFGIGAGDWPDLHTRDYEYPDELLEHQIDAFIKLLQEG